MFCQNCGDKISKIQKFCASCGSAVSNTPDAPQLEVEENQVSIPVKSVPVYESKTINVGGPGPHSKKTFAFAIVSLALAGVGFAFGGIYFIRMLTPYYYYLYPYASFGIIGLIVGVILNITGLIFGILSRTNCSKARKFEPVNTLEKVGSVFGVFGIVINSIFIVLIPIILITSVIPMLLLGPYYP